jgi:hypothetical protein
MTIYDMKVVVDTAQQQYNPSTKHERARKWLRSFSIRIMYYGDVLDMLAQHHPEYVALVWGTLKFVLTVRGKMMLRKNIFLVTCSAVNKDI